MKQISKILILTILLSSCAGSDRSQLDSGFIINCNKIITNLVTDKRLDMSCLDGSSSINFYEIKGPIVVNLWSSWCESCQHEISFFVDLYNTKQFKSGEIKLLGVNVAEKNADSATRFIKAYGISWPHLVDPDNRSKSLFGVGIPVTWFIDANGLVVKKQIGAYTKREQLFSQVEQAFGVKL